MLCIFIDIILDFENFTPVTLNSKGFLNDWVRGQIIDRGLV